MSCPSAFARLMGAAECYSRLQVGLLLTHAVFQFDASFCPSVCLYFGPSHRLSAYHSVSLPVYLCVCLSIHLYIYVCMHESIHLTFLVSHSKRLIHN